MPEIINHLEFNKLEDKVYDSDIAPTPSGKLSVSVELKDGVSFFLQAGDTISGQQEDEAFKGYFDGVVKYDPDKGWGIQVRTGPMEAMNLYFEELSSLKIYD